MASIQLISTDFDGTLISVGSDGRCLPRLAERLEILKSQGCLWAINTGRSLEHMVEGLSLFSCPVSPDFLVVNERHVYVEANGGWESIEPWNRNCDEIHASLRAETESIVQEIKNHAVSAGDFSLIWEDGEVAGLLADTELVMDRVVEVLAEYRKKHPDFDFQRNSIYLRFSHRHFTKGTALAEVARICQLLPSQIFAAGDNHNDLSMLDGTHARWVACPSNSIPEVKSTVLGGKGFVSTEESAAGISAALEHFFTGSSNAHLPVGSLAGR